MEPRILIVDDHEIVRKGVRTLLGAYRPNWLICGEATSGVEAVRAVESLHPDVVVMDITMPGLSGLDATTHIHRSHPECRIIIFTMHESGTLESDVRSTGAQGYVL